MLDVDVANFIAAKVGGVYITRAVISEMAGMQNVDIANFGV
jgi:hypothetical protein